MFLILKSASTFAPPINLIMHTSVSLRVPASPLLAYFFLSCHMFKLCCPCQIPGIASRTYFKSAKVCKPYLAPECTRTTELTGSSSSWFVSRIQWSQITSSFMRFKHCRCQLPKARDVGGLTRASSGWQ